MAGPARQQTIKLIVPPGEAQVQYSAASLAYKVQNFETTPEGTLTTVVGPTVYEPERSKVVESTTVGDYTQRFDTSDIPHSIFHTMLSGGLSDTLIIRMGSRLYRHAGWYRGWEILADDLSSDDRAEFPDQFTVLSNQIIWTNGVDNARVIRANGQVSPLGFTEIPAAPSAEGPRSDSQDANGYPNRFGYFWPGRIRTVGDVLSGQTGALLSGTWYYHVRFEDINGNLSAPSPASNPCSLRTMQASPMKRSWFTGDNEGFSAELDDLTKQFLVTSPEAPEHCVAVHIYRTPDTKHASTIPRFLTRVPNNRECFLPDNFGDSDLGSEMGDGVPVPVFRVRCTHQGRLVIANTPDDPGIVRRSDPGFPGTFSEFEFVYPDIRGAQVTGLISHGGVLLAFTETGVYSLEEFSTPIPLTQGIGCVAPKSIAALPDGTLMWLARDGFYMMRGTAISRASIPIDRTVRHFLNRGRLRKASAMIDATSGEYRCSVAPAGISENTLMLCFDGSTWRRQKLGLHIADMCSLDDWRQYSLAIGKVDYSGSSSYPTVYVLGRETRNFTPPARTAVYRSGWLKADEIGVSPVNVRSMYIGMVDAWNGDVTIKFYRNGSWDERVSMTDLKAIGVDDGSNVVTDIAGSAVIGTAKTHDPRLFWRQVPVGLENAMSWAFEITATYPVRLHLASFAFDISAATSGSIRGRIPLRADE